MPKIAPLAMQGFNVGEALVPTLGDLDSWPATDLNNVLHAHDELQPLLTDTLCPKWKQALKSA